MSNAVNASSSMWDLIGRPTQPIGRHPLGFCEQNNLVHAWEPALLVETLRCCANCGRVQRLVPEQWVDAPMPDSELPG